MENKIEKLNSFKKLESIIDYNNTFKFMFHIKSENVYWNKFGEIDYKYLKEAIELKYKRKIYFFLQIKPTKYCNEIYFINKLKTRLFKVSNNFQKYNLVNFEKAKSKWIVGTCLIKNLNFIKLDFKRRVIEKNNISSSQKDNLFNQKEDILFNQKEYIPLVEIKKIPENKIKKNKIIKILNKNLSNFEGYLLLKSQYNGISITFNKFNWNFYYKLSAKNIAIAFLKKYFYFRPNIFYQIIYHSNKNYDKKDLNFWNWLEKKDINLAQLNVVIKIFPKIEKDFPLWLQKKIFNYNQLKNEKKIICEQIKIIEKNIKLLEKFNKLLLKNSGKLTELTFENELLNLKLKKNLKNIIKIWRKKKMENKNEKKIIRGKMEFIEKNIEFFNWTKKDNKLKFKNLIEIIKENKLLNLKLKKYL